MQEEIEAKKEHVLADERKSSRALTGTCFSFVLIRRQHSIKLYCSGQITPRNKLLALDISGYLAQGMEVVVYPDDQSIDTQ